MNKLPEDNLEQAGYWQINLAGGGSFNINVHSGAHGTAIPRVDDSGGAIRFYYPDGRRKIYSYSAIRSAEYVPIELAPF